MYIYTLQNMYLWKLDFLSRTFYIYIYTYKIYTYIKRIYTYFKTYEIVTILQVCGILDLIKYGTLISLAK